MLLQFFTLLCLVGPDTTTRHHHWRLFGVRGMEREEVCCCCLMSLLLFHVVNGATISMCVSVHILVCCEGCCAWVAVMRVVWRVLAVPEHMCS